MNDRGGIIDDVARININAPQRMYQVAFKRSYVAETFVMDVCFMGGDAGFNLRTVFTGPIVQ